MAACHHHDALKGSATLTAAAPETKDEAFHVLGRENKLQNDAITCPGKRQIRIPREIFSDFYYDGTGYLLTNP